MTAIILLIICLLASSVGAIVGAGGGVIIKPVLDMLGILPVSTVSFCSGCTVLGMSVCSLIRNRNDGVKLQIKTRKAATGSSKEIVFRFPKSGISVNAKYLERIYEFMGGENVHAFTCDSEKRKTTPIILTNYNGEEAMLCTVRDYSGGVNA